MKKLVPKLIGLWLNFIALFLPRVAGKKAFFIFATVRRAPMKDYHIKFLDTSVKTTIDVEGINIQCYQWGTGPKKILFIHGWQSHSFRWKKYVEMFSGEDYTLYAIDGPAHGLSGNTFITLPLYAKCILQVVDEIGPIDALIAHSFGGFASVYALYLNPSVAVRKMVLMGVPGEAAEIMSDYRKFLKLSGRTMKALLKFFGEYIGHTPNYFSTVRFASQSATPALIIHDELDDEAPYSDASRLHEVWRNSELMTTRGVGHNLKSPEVMERILEFVEQDTTVSPAKVHRGQKDD